MLINRGWSYLTGYLNIEVTGEDLEAFINMAITRGIFLWEIRRVNERTLRARVRISGFFGLRHISRRTRCRMRIRGRRGLPFLAVKIRKRKMLALGGLLFLMILYGLASFVWVVNVSGTNQLEPEQILEAANRHGLRVGTLRSQLDKSLIEDQLKEDFPAASFINLQIKGTTVNIEIVEKVLPPELETERQAAHIVARRDGIIEDVVVMAGLAQVKPGDTVRKGEVLISGIVPPAAEQEQMPGVILPPPLETGPRYVHAKGIVKARIWYEGYGDAYLVEKEELDSGEQTQQFWLNLRGKEVLVWGPRQIPYPHYRLTQEEKFWSFKANLPWELNLPAIRVRVVHYYGVEVQEIPLEPEAAEQLALERANKQIAELRAAESETVQEDRENLSVEDPNQVRVRVRLEAIEEVGQEKLFSHP